MSAPMKVYGLSLHNQEVVNIFDRHAAVMDMMSVFREVLSDPGKYKKLADEAVVHHFEY